MTEITHRFIDTNGIRMHIAEAGTGPLVLLCHGFPESWYSWRHQLPALAAAGFHAVAPDMRGYGQTDRPDGIDQYTLLHLIGDMVGLLDALGTGTAVIAGHDWGGPVAWHAALLRPDRFPAVIGLSVPYRPRGQARPTAVMPQTDDAVFYQLHFQTPGVAEAELEHDVRASIQGLLIRVSGNAPAGTPVFSMVPRVGGLRARSHAPLPATLPAWLTEADIEYYAGEFTRTGFRGGLNWYRNIDRNWELLAPFADAMVTVPALYVAGDRDLVLSFPGAKELLANLTTFVPQLRQTIILPGCGHWTQQERPEAVNAAMIDFLRGLWRMVLTEDLAARFATIALGHATREYPHALTHVLDGPGDVQTPRGLHPIFYGSFDWHSCVHAYWMLARLLYLYPDMPPAAQIRALFDAQITANAVAAECAYLLRPAARGFERPYGWAWFLKLADAMRQIPDRPWYQTLAPLAATFVARFTDFLPKATYPVRVGTHTNTAFALALAHEYADADLRARFRRSAETWYGADAGCQAWEPSGDEFLSPALIEAECMRRLLPPDRFLPWFDRFLPDLAQGRPETLFVPAGVSDRSDGKIAHLDGLNLSRAWCWRSLATALPAEDPRRPVMLQAADVHLAVGLPHVAGDYMGEHWLASFAMLALDC